MPLTPENPSLIDMTTLAPRVAPVPPSADLKPVLSWMAVHVFPHPSSQALDAMVPAGLAIGFAGAYSAIPLGIGFGDIVAGAAQATAAGYTASAIYFATVSYAPVAILISIPTWQHLQRYVHWMRDEQELPALDDRPRWRAFATCFTTFVSLFAGTPFLNLVYEEVQPLPVIEYILPTCAMIASYFAIIDPGNALKDNLLDRFERVPAEVEMARNNILTQINNAMHSIQTMRDHEVKALYQALQNTDDPAFARLQMLFGRQAPAPDHVTDYYATTMSRLLFGIDAPTSAPAATQTTRSYIRTLIRDTLGYAIGGASSYVFYGLAVQTSNSFVANAALGSIVGIIGCGVNVIFTAKWGQSRATQLYTPGAGRANLKPTLSGSVLQILAFSGSAPGTYVALTTATGVFGILGGLATFVGGGLAKYPGFDYLANTIMDGFENIWSHDTASVQKKKLGSMLDKIRQQVRHLHPTPLMALSAALPAKLAIEPQPLSIRTEVPEVKTPEPSPSRVVIHQSLFPPSPRASTQTRPETPRTPVSQHMTP